MSNFEIDKDIGVMSVHRDRIMQIVNQIEGSVGGSAITYSATLLGLQNTLETFAAVVSVLRDANDKKIAMEDYNESTDESTDESSDESTDDEWKRGNLLAGPAASAAAAGPVAAAASAAAAASQNTARVTSVAADQAFDSTLKDEIEEDSPPSSPFKWRPWAVRGSAAASAPAASNFVAATAAYTSPSPKRRRSVNNPPSVKRTTRPYAVGGYFEDS